MNLQSGWLLSRGIVASALACILLACSPARAQHAAMTGDKAGSAKCLECHDLKDPKLQKSHHNMLFATSNCLSCHQPDHQGGPKHLRAFEHPPFATGNCELCHAPAVDGKVKLNQPSEKALCLSCHDDKVKLIDSSKVHHPGASGDCTTCHNPHASDKPGLAKTDSVSICLSCHTDFEDLKKKSVHHQPAFGEGCATCHTPHGGDEEHLLRAKGNALCLECHAAGVKPTPLPERHMVAIFDGKVKLPEDYFQKNHVPVLHLSDGKGHPVPGHPVSDVLDPADHSKVKTPMSCLSCHQPHASAQPGLLIGDQPKGHAFCATCHQKMMSEQPAAVTKN
jgi:predicted CXXCH cytochrome family protein